jgi:hypothetical protein
MSGRRIRYIDAAGMSGIVGHLVGIQTDRRLADVSVRLPASWSGSQEWRRVGDVMAPCRRDMYKSLTSQCCGWACFYCTLLLFVALLTASRRQNFDEVLAYLLDISTPRPPCLMGSLPRLNSPGVPGICYHCRCLALKRPWFFVERYNLPFLLLSTSSTITVVTVVKTVI